MIALIAAILLATTPEEHAVGLMGRKTLNDNEGMLFVYEKPESHTFWSFGCYCSLSIAFLDENRVICEIYELPCHPEWHKSPYHPISSYNDLQKALREEPLLARFTQTAVSSKGSYRYVLEMPSGWFKRHNLTVGMTFSSACRSIRH